MRFQSITALAITAFSALNLVIAEANPVAAPAITPAPERRNAAVQDKRQLNSLIPESLLSVVLGGGTDLGSLLGSLENAASTELAGLATADPQIFSSIESQLSSLGGFSGIDSLLSSIGSDTSGLSTFISGISTAITQSDDGTTLTAGALSTASSGISAAAATVSSIISSASSVASSAASSSHAATTSSAGFAKVEALPQGWGLAVALVAVGLGGGMLRFL